MSLFLECLIIDYLPYLLPRYILVFVFFFFGLVWFGSLFVVCCCLPASHPHPMSCHGNGL